MPISADDVYIEKRLGGQGEYKLSLDIKLSQSSAQQIIDFLYENPDSSDSFPVTITFMARSEKEENGESKAFDEVNGTSSITDNLQTLKLVDCETDILPPAASAGDTALDFRTLGYHGGDYTFSWQSISLFTVGKYQAEILGEYSFSMA